MGGKAHSDPTPFASDLNRYLAWVLEENKHPDLSGKWLARITGGARSYDYWAKLVKDSRAMTTNDIAVLAEAFGISPYEWVRNARRRANGDLVEAAPRPANVGPDPEAIETSEFPTNLRAVAEEERKPGDK